MRGEQSPLFLCIKNKKISKKDLTNYSKCGIIIIEIKERGN